EELPGNDHGAALLEALDRAPLIALDPGELGHAEEGLGFEADERGLVFLQGADAEDVGLDGEERDRAGVADDIHGPELGLGRLWKVKAADEGVGELDAVEPVAED